MIETANRGFLELSTSRVRIKNLLFKGEEFLFSITLLPGSVYTKFIEISVFLDIKMLNATKSV